MTLATIAVSRELAGFPVVWAVLASYRPSRRGTTDQPSPPGQIVTRAEFRATTRMRATDRGKCLGTGPCGTQWAGGHSCRYGPLRCPEVHSRRILTLDGEFAFTTD